MPKIFVSHRRKSSEAITGRILDRLVGHYGKPSIFIDIDNIGPGVDFRQRINQVLNECDIMIVVVGPKWLGPAKSKDGRLSIQRENDWVRLEVETALRRNVLVIPVLVDGAEMPESSVLPDSLKDFAYRNAETVASGRDFHMHVDRLIGSIDEMVASKAASTATLLSAPTAETKDPAVAVPSGEGGEAATKADAPVRLTASKSVAENQAPAEERSQAAQPVLIFTEPAPTSNTADVPLPPDGVSPQAAARPNRQRYLAAAAVVLLLAGSGAIIYWPKPQLAGDGPSTVVAAPGPKAAPIPPAAGPTKAPELRAAAPPVPGNTSAPPTEVSVSTKPVVSADVKRPVAPPQSCLARMAQAQPADGATGGPFFPVSIRPNLADAYKIRSVAVSPTGGEIATAADDGVIRIWDASSFKLIRTLRGHSGEVYSLDYWIDGTLLASASFDGTIRVWNASDGSIAQKLDTRLFGGVPVKQFSVAFYPGKPLKFLASGGEDGVVRIWNYQTGAVEKTRDPPSPEREKQVIRSLSYAPNGLGEFVTGAYDGKIRVYLTTKNQVLTLDANARKVLRTAYSPDSSRIVTAGTDGDLAQNAASLKIWNVKTQASQTLLGHRDYVVAASWSPDGKRLVTGGGGRDKSVMLWDTESGKPLATFSGHQADIEAVAFFAGGSRIVSVGEDKTIRVWNVPERKEILTAVGFGEREYAVYTPAGCYSGSQGVESRLAASYDNRPAAFNKEALFVPEGFGALLAGR